MKNRLFAALIAAVALSGCVSTGASSSSGMKWTGVVAVQESAYVWQLYDTAAGNLTFFAQLLEAGLDQGTVRPATGTFNFYPYAGGRAVDEAHTVTLRLEHNGTWYFQGPSEFFAPGRAMCVEAPTWSVIATQRRFPAAAGPRTNCIDFGPEAASPGFASTQYNAATIIMVQPQN